MATRQPPRGVRNNNPGNIRHSRDPWQGLSETQTDPDFFQFKTPVDGVRALAKVLLTYYDKRLAADGSKIDTIEELVERFAPGADNNDEEAYVNHLCKLTGKSPHETLNLHDYDDLRGIVIAQIAHECANYRYPPEVIDEALRRVGVVKRAPVIAGPINKQNAAIGGASTVIATVGGVSDAWDRLSAAVDPRIIIGIGLAIVVGVLAYTTYQWVRQRKLGVH